MKKILVFLFLVLLGNINLFSQEVVVLKGDTVITLEKKNVETLNEIALHRKFLLKELQLCDSIGILKDSIIQERDEEIKKYISISKINNAKIDVYYDEIQELEKEIKKKNRENGLILGGGIFAFLMGVLFL